MKVKSNIKPQKYKIENISGDICDVIFNININKKTMLDDIDKSQKVEYEYDSYRTQNCYYKGIELEIERNFNVMVENAKKVEYARLAKEVRTKRDELLKETDKEMCLDRLNLHIPEKLDPTTLLSGVKDFFEALKMVTNDDMAKYRQQLRDIPNQPGFPYKVDFPDIPKKKIGGL